MNRRYGYKEPSHQQGATTNSLKPAGTMDRALRAEIISNAQRRYEAAARQLWMRTQAEAQAQVKALAQPREQERVYAHAHQTYSRTHRQEWPPSQGRSMVHPQAQVQVQAGPSRTPSYLSPSPTLRPPSYTHIASPSTPAPVLYRFRQVPNKPSPKSDSNKTQKEGDLEVEELKRRYYEQLSNQGYSQTRVYGEPPRSRSAMSYDVRMPFAQGSSGAPVRTMADEYLDYYMPARRGPQSSHRYQRLQQETALRQAEKRVAEERYRRQELERRSQNFTPSIEIDRRREVFEPPVQRSYGDQPSRTRQEDKEDKEEGTSVQPRPSKAKLSFLLNPSELDCGKASLLSKDRDDGMFAQRQGSKFDRPAMRDRSNSYQGASTSRGDLERAGESPVDPGLQLPIYGRPSKRKQSPLPDSPYHSEGSDKDEAPRAKRRAFGRLPAEYDDNHSELGPEEEDRDEVYEAQSSRRSSERASSGRTGSPPDEEASLSEMRQKFAAHPAATEESKDKDSESNIDDDDDDDESEGQRPSTPSYDGSKKYYFRPRPKAVSR